MQILAASGCTIEENMDYTGNDMTFSVVESIQHCANFAQQDKDKGTMGTLGWVFYPDNGHCRPQKTLVHSYIKPCISVLGRGLTEFKQIIWFQLRHLSLPIRYAI